jgi:hypothetical protein
MCRTSSSLPLRAVLDLVTVYPDEALRREERHPDDRLHDITFQEPEIEDIIRRIYEEGLLLQEVP